jgi:hypothetical protein
MTTHENAPPPPDWHPEPHPDPFDWYMSTVQLDTLAKGLSLDETEPHITRGEN